MRFVILKHSRQGCDTHYDLMIEQFEGSEKLTTYSLPLAPRELMTAGEAQGKRIFDHDRRFLEYEGAVNKGEGSVQRVDEGAVETQDIAFDKHGISPCQHVFDGMYLSGVFEITDTDGVCHIQKKND